MRLKKSLLTIICFALAAFAFSQVKKPAAKPKPKPAITPFKEVAIKGDNSLLFEISGHGLTTPSWLFGTMHVLCEGDATLSEGLKKVIQDSKQVYFEMDLDDLEETMSALKYVRMNNGLKMSDLLTPVEYERVKVFFDQHKSMMPFAMMNRFKPFFISAMVGEEILGCERKISMEQMIMTETKKYEKNVLGLETMEFQASLFDSIPYEEQAKELLNYVDSIATYKKMMEETVAMYKKQNIRGLDSLTKLSDPGMSKYLGMLLYDRNKRWMSQISEQIFQTPTLFAVGAGHLGGENGLIDLLRKEGFTVKALKN